jgi:hypothetical protein
MQLRAMVTGYALSTFHCCASCTERREERGERREEREERGERRDERRSTGA